MVPYTPQNLRSFLQRLVLDPGLLDRFRRVGAAPPAVPEEAAAQGGERAVPDRRSKERHLPGGRRAADQWRDGVADQPPRERRKETRYIPFERRAYLGWWVGESFRTIAVRTENVSRSGASLLVEDFPSDVDTVWLCPFGPFQQDWYRANVKGIAPSGGVGQIVRLALGAPLPYDVFKSLVWGFPSEVFSRESSARPRPDSIAGDAPEPVDQQAGAGAPRVLIVEPDMATRFALRGLFERQGWCVTLANDVEEALASLDPAPDWIVMNPWLPQGDGEEVLRAVRRGGGPTRIAIIPGLFDPEPAPRFDEFAPDLLMPRPIDFDRLIAVCSGADGASPPPVYPRWMEVSAV